MKHVPKYIREIARNLRNHMTQAEVVLWSRIKNEQLGCKFLRQKPIYVFTEDSGLERYIIPDFYCSEKRILIEVDGGIHLQDKVLFLDKEKQRLLEQQGYTVIRFTNEDILENLSKTIKILQSTLQSFSLGKREYPRHEGEGFELEANNTKRCAWANPNNELYLKYHDQEWGVPVYDDIVLFEFLVLEGAQAGLSWETVLKKRENYRIAFDQFDCKKVAEYDKNKVAELLGNDGIIRNKLKVHSAIKNAKAFLEIQEEFGSFSDYLWKYVDGKQIVNTPKTMSEVPVSTKLSDTLSKDLKKRGMSFVGTTIMYAYLQAVGVVDDHVEDCFCKK